MSGKIIDFSVLIALVRANVKRTMDMFFTIKDKGGNVAIINCKLLLGNINITFTNL